MRKCFRTKNELKLTKTQIGGRISCVHGLEDKLIVKASVLRIATYTFNAVRAHT